MGPVHSRQGQIQQLQMLEHASCSLNAQMLIPIRQPVIQDQMLASLTQQPQMELQHHHVPHIHVRPRL